MKKKNKILIAVIVIVLMIVGLASYLVPMLLLREATKEILPEAKRAEYITDVESLPENGIEVDNGGYTMQIPDYLTKVDYDKANVYHVTDDEVKYFMFTEAFDESMSLVDPEFYEEDATMKKYGIKDVRKMFESLGYGTPDSYYNILKCVSLLDWEDYSIFSVRKSVAFSAYAYLRAELYMELDNYIYERGDVRAIIQSGEEGHYMIDVFHVDNLNGAYGMMINDKNLSLEQVAAMLNTVKFKQE